MHGLTLQVTTELLVSIWWAAAARSIEDQECGKKSQQYFIRLLTYRPQAA